MTDRTSRHRALAALVVVGLLLVTVLIAGLAAGAGSVGDPHSIITSSADSSDQHATDRSTAPAPQVVAVRPQPTRAFAFGQLRVLLAILAVLGAAVTGLAAGSAGRRRLGSVLADGITLLPHRRGPPALV